MLQGENKEQSVNQALMCTELFEQANKLSVSLEKP